MVSMRLLIFSMPAVAVVAILSVGLQRSITTNDPKSFEAALPEATRIYQRVASLKASQESAKPYTSLATPTRRYPMDSQW